MVLAVSVSTNDYSPCSTKNLHDYKFYLKLPWAVHWNISCWWRHAHAVTCSILLEYQTFLQ